MELVMEQNKVLEFNAKINLVRTCSCSGVNDFGAGCITLDVVMKGKKIINMKSESYLKNNLDSF